MFSEVRRFVSFLTVTKMGKLKNSRYMQYVASISAALCVSICGTYTSWTSPALTILSSDESPIGRPITDVS